MTTKTSSVLPPPGLSNSKKLLLEQRLRGARQQARAPGIPRRADPKRAPLSFAQQRLWFLDQLEPNSPMYNMPVAVRVRGPLDRVPLGQAINAIVARHDMLRTRFVSHEGEPVQEVMPPAPVQVAVVDLREVASTRRETELMTRLREVAREPFNVSKELPMRVTLFELAPEDHALMLNMHHIASDAWSFGVFFEELKAFYNHFAHNDTLQLADLPIQYGDYAAWQRATLTGDVLREHSEYWRKKLAGAPELLELPTDRPRPPAQTFRGAHEFLTLPAQLVASLKKVSQHHRVTPFMLLLAGFKTLLHRYCRQDDLMVGSPIAGRTQLETERLIGFFINTLVLRTDFSGDPTFVELLDRVRTTMLEAYAHQDMPFDKLVEELRPQRTTSYSPLIQAMFVLHNIAPALTVGSAALEYIDVDTSTSKFDLVLSMEEAKGTMIADMEYNADLFEAATIKRLLQNFVVLLEGVSANPQQHVSELPLLTETERELLASWNETECDFPQNTSVAELFERVATSAPDAIALVDGSIECTYAELNERANQLARHLQKLGVKDGTPVAVYLDRGVAMIVTFLAILKAGGAYVPLDRSYPKDRITLMVEDTETPVLITTKALQETLPVTHAKVLCLDTEEKRICAEKADNLSNGVRGDGLAYIIYTSGSTGRPKGVCVPHRGIARLVLNVDYSQIRPDDIVSQISNCSFDAATWEIWGALLNGARLVIFRPEVLLTVRDFTDALARHKITTMFLTTALFNQIAAEAPAAFRSIKHLLFGGEAADPKWVAEVLRHGSPERLLNVYGPTEGTTYATWYLVKEPPENAQSIPIGRPIANTTAWVLDKTLKLTPIGVPGELHVGGAGVAIGYLNRPELTAEKFVRHRHFGRLYRTGDLVRRLPSGDLEFLGRIDEQVKIRGFRVEPGEIESTLSRHANVSQCVVLARKDAAGSKQLVGYFAPKQTPAPTADEIRAFLKSRLPDYMVPAFLVAVPQMPITPNGKIDRKALPEPESLRGAGEQKRLEPRDAVEQQLQEIWQTVLGVSPIGVQDKFFELGGHSLLALRLIAQIEKKFGRKLPVTAIFQSPTIEQLAEILRGKGEWTPVSSLVEIQRGGKRPPLVLVHGVGGGMFWGYSNLAHYLDPEQPVFAFKSRGMDGQDEYETIEEMASHYVSDLRKFQPHGPYYLGGYCFGGIVAYEMACMLQAQGEEVALLALLNSCPPNSSYTHVRFGWQFAWRFVANLGQLFVNSLKWTPEQRKGFLQWKWRLLRTQLFGRRAGDGDIDEWVDLSPFPEDQKKLWETHLRALMRYYPKPYAGRLTLFRSRAHQLMSSYDPKYGWGEFAKGGVTVKVVPGAHESIVEEPNVKELAAEFGRVLDDAQTKDPTYPELFRAQARKTPSATAVRHDGKDLTYAELDRRSDLVGGFLRNAGVGPESIVAVALPRSIDFAIAVLGVMKAGGAYLPLDLSHPAERLAYYISDSGAKLVIAQSRDLRRSTARVVAFAEASAGPPCEGTIAGPDNLAYIMYTSGSTGAPKGVQITHRSLVNHNLAVAQAFELGASDHVLQFASLSFDLSVEEIFPIWLRGGTLVFRPNDVIASVTVFLEFIAREQITVLDLPTAYWHELVDACKGKFMPQCVRLVVIGGEQATFDRLKVWTGDIRHNARLINTYGPTEATVTATMYEAGPECLERGMFPIGKPIANTFAHVLDEKLQRVPAGSVGQLYIGGAGVARGYLNRPELTQEKFVSHPELDRLYRTGDLVRELPDGNLEFLGRIDNQMKVRGFRVEPGEIESTMRQYPAVKDAVVTQRQGRLVGYYIPAMRCKQAELANFLREKLPDYMVPAALVALESLPSTPNGKVDRAALPAPEFARPELEEPFVAPASDFEKRLAAIWCDVLGLDRVGTKDNFFHLGGHSLQAMQVISRAECELGLRISVKAFFDGPTITVLSTAQHESAPPFAPSPNEHQGAVPLSFAQQRLWFLDQLQPDSAVYNIPQPIRLKGALRVDALQRALNEIVRRHEVLRTTYPTVDDSPIQQINPPRPVALRVVNLEHLENPQREADLHRELVAEAQKPFNLREDVMLRALLVQLEPEENVLLLTIHHIAADAWSLGVILSELATLYNCFSKGQPSPLPELSVQYRHFALERRAEANGLVRQLAYWKDQLAQAPSLFEWPADNPRPAMQSHRGGSLRFLVPSSIAEQLQALARKEGSTPFMTLLAAFQTLAFRYTGREDIITGSAIANRSRPEFEALVGFFVNTLPLRTRIEPRMTFRQLLQRARQVTIAAYEHQDLPFDRLVEELQPERDTSYQPLIQTMFIQLNVPMPETPGAGIAWLPFELDFGQSRFDLTLEMNETTRGLEGRMEYAADLFEPATIARMAAQYQTLLESIITDPDQPVCDLRILPDSETQQLLVEWNNTALEIPKERCLHSLFEEQAQRTPPSVALIHGNERITYAELNSRADAVAAKLAELGVGPEKLVGICLERNANLVRGILGTLKSGAAYVALDPAYPKERVEFMLSDSKAAIVLTQRKFADQFKENVLCIEDIRDSRSKPSVAVRPENLAYVIYTSGSTGRPKGVAIEHRSAVNLVSWAKTVYTPEELDGVLASTSVCFDLSVFELFIPLCLGGKVILAENAFELASLPAAEEVRLLNTVPSAITQLLELQAVPATVQVINLAGEPLTRQLADRIYAETKARKVYDLYGPTEDTVYATYALREPGGPATIGRPVANNKLYILSPQGQPVPIGVPGELFIGGNALARGYLHRPDLTTERFLPDPFSNEPGARMYRTGDLARFLPDGNVEFLGRIDHQVKIRGFRIELGEIEELLREHPKVREAVVTARDDRGGDKRLSAYVTARNGQPPRGPELADWLNEKLPDYMVPRLYTVLPAFPLTANGKIDRKSLPEPELNRENDTPFLEPANEIEKLLARIWCEVLDLQTVGVNDNFFKLGGHSLKITQVISRVREAVGVELPMRAIFEAPTIAALALRIEELLIEELNELSEEEAQRLNAQSE